MSTSPAPRTSSIAARRSTGGRAAPSNPAGRAALRQAALGAALEVRGLPGSEAALNRRELARVDFILERAGDDTVTRVLELVDSVSSKLARATLLRAAAARAAAVADAGAPDHARAMEVLARFAKKLGALDDHEIRRRASVIDRDPKNASTLDAQALWDRRGRTSDVARDDGDGDNDGLLQRFTASCGPTTLQMMMGEADPVFAFAVVDAGVTSVASDDRVAVFQRALLEAAGGVALGRLEAFDRSRLRNLLGRMPNVDVRKAILAHVQHAAPLGERAAHAFAELRAKTGGFPDDDAVARLRSEKWPERDAGIDTDALVGLMHEHLTPLTGVRYRAVSCARGHAWRHIDAVSKALKRGVDVAIGTDEPPHWMLVSAARGRKPAREFLVSDPDGGRTAWVGERALLRGTFGNEPFHLPKPGERPYVDTFILPELP